MLTKDRLTGVGRDLSLPVGFGERSQMLLNLFRAAAELERLPQLLDTLRAEVDRWERTYLHWSDEYPASRAIWDEWRGRLADTRALLEEMTAATS